MLYIKENSAYTRYYTDSNERFISHPPGGSQSSILPDISEEYDGIIGADGNLHFVLQGTKGDLIYLKRDKSNWKKFTILKSRNGRMKISHLRIACSKNTLCAFYIMEHNGRNLFVRHRFSDMNLFEEPTVIGTCDIRQNYSLCRDEAGIFMLFFRGENKAINMLMMNPNFSIISDKNYTGDSDIIRLKAIYLKTILCKVYTAAKQNSTVIVFTNDKYKDEKIISFAVSRNCNPEILTQGDNIYIQWAENGCIMQSESQDMGLTFSKPHIISNSDMCAKLRNSNSADDIRCDICAITDDIPYLGNIYRAKNKIKESNTMKSSFKPDSTTDRIATMIIHNLDNIKKDLDTMNDTLTEICEFTEKLCDFKYNIKSTILAGNVEYDSIEIADDTAAPKDENTVISSVPDISDTHTDIGNKIEENIKLFENTEIDEVLPEVKNI